MSMSAPSDSLISSGRFHRTINHHVPSLPSLQSQLRKWTSQYLVQGEIWQVTGKQYPLLMMIRNHFKIHILIMPAGAGMCSQSMIKSRLSNRIHHERTLFYNPGNLSTSNANKCCSTTLIRIS